MSHRPSAPTKRFFKNRPQREIEALARTETDTHAGLTARLARVPEHEAIALTLPLIPDWARVGTTDKDAAAYFARNAPFVPIDTAADRTNQSRVRHALARLSAWEESRVPFLGYAWRPATGNDTRLRTVRFDDLVEGMRRLTYGLKLRNERVREGAGLELTIYKDTPNIAERGASGICRIPHTHERTARREAKLASIPYVANAHARAIGLGISIEITPVSRDDFYGDIEIPRPGAASDAPRFVRLHKDAITALMFVAYSEGKRDNPTPARELPLVCVGESLARIDHAIRNNLLVMDARKEALRTPHPAERALLLGRAIATLGRNSLSFSNPIAHYSW